MKYNHIIWDYDGTLFNSYPAMASACSAAMAERGISESVKSIIPYMKVSMRYAFEHYAEKYRLDETFIGRYKELAKAAEEADAMPFDGAAELCHAICENGGRNYLFTHRGESALYFIEKFGLTACFSEFITSTRNFPRKPSPEAILYLMEKHSFSCGDALMVGDRDLDMESAKGAGIHTCYFTCGGEPSVIADINIGGFAELKAVLGIG